MLRTSNFLKSLFEDLPTHGPKARIVQKTVLEQPRETPLPFTEWVTSLSPLDLRNSDAIVSALQSASDSMTAQRTASAGVQTERTGSSSMLDMPETIKMLEDKKPTPSALLKRRPSELHIPEKNAIAHLVPRRGQVPQRKTITPANYNALEAHGYFGLIHMERGCYGEDHLVVHTSSRMDKQHMLSLQAGDQIPVVYLDKEPRKGVLTVRFVTRSHYFSPGHPVTSVRVAVDGWLDETERMRSKAHT